MKNNAGFTLIELLVVISIISLLSTVVISSVAYSRERAALTKTVEEMRSLYNAIEQYRLDNGKVPNQGASYTYIDTQGNSGLTTYLSALLVPKYIPKIPTLAKGSYVLGYRTVSSSNQNQYCGEKLIENYEIYFFEMSQPLNLPRANYTGGWFDNSIRADISNSQIVDDPSGMTGGPGTYCISG